MIATLLALRIANAADPVVSIPGIGQAPLPDAIATCNNGYRIGGLAAEAVTDREPAFRLKAKADLAASTDQPWPRTALDVSYVGNELGWVERGVITSCWAVGHYYVQLGLELRTLCNNDRSKCRARFAADEQDTIKEPTKGKVKNRRDAMFTALAQLPDLHTWHDPRPFLYKACTHPQQTAAAGRFIDADDLASARSACVQLLELLQGDATPTLTALPCAGEWSSRPADVLPSPDTDLGVQGAHVDIQVATTIDKLTRMHTGAGECPDSPEWGATWREGLVERWREAQASRACIDVDLPLEDRLTLCPQMLERAKTDCRRQDETACDLLAQLHIEGVGVEADEEAAMDVWATSCNAAHAPACDAIKSRSSIIQGWLDDALAHSQTFDVSAATGASADPFAESHKLLARFGNALGAEWVAAHAPTLFDNALTHKREKDASDVVSLYGTTLGETWKADARQRLGALQEELAKQ